MNAPDKIYTDNRGGYATLPVFSQTDANIEYIRKDALLKWLEENKKEMEKELEGSPAALRFATAIAISSFQEVIDKLNNY